MSKYIIKLQGSDWKLSFGRINQHVNDVWNVHMIIADVDETEDQSTSSAGIGGHVSAVTNNLEEEHEARIAYEITPENDSSCQCTLLRGTTSMQQQTFAVKAGITSTGVFRVGFLQKGAPTYLETLDKLDQWSSSQYIPEGTI